MRTGILADFSEAHQFSQHQIRIQWELSGKLRVFEIAQMHPQAILQQKSKMVVLTFRLPNLQQRRYLWWRWNRVRPLDPPSDKRSPRRKASNRIFAAGNDRLDIRV